MLNPTGPLIAHISRHFTLQPGDVVLTGTPKGVGPLHPGQTLTLELEDLLFLQTRVT
jgi:2-keto-4-pentenoate hydratase/2-oxohepta-3-ene-1,7-dioic acid hydratase in catechol pathway